MSIPTEILAIIADILLNKEKFGCITVCKQWYNVFWHSLWKRIEINSQGKLETICTQANIQQSIYQQHGHRSQELYINFNGQVTDSHLKTLRLCFPNLKRLCIKTGLSQPTILEEIHDQSLWESLTHLSICSSRDDLGSMAEAHLDILKFVPHLIQLEFTGYNGGEGKCTWQDIETVHARLPKLENLKICMEGYGIELDEMEHLKNIVPATKITALATGIFEWDITWAYYFACKYPNIQKMDCSFEPIPNDSNDFKKTLSMIMNLHRPFQYLNTIDIYESMLPDCVHGSIISILSKLSVNIKSIKYKVDSFSDDATKDTANDSIKRMVNGSSASLERFSLDCQVYLSLTDLFANIGICTRLVDLELTIQLEEIFLDSLLGYCKNLKKLTIRSHICMHLRILSNTIQPHGLEIFEVYDSAIHVESFKKLSDGCRKLSRMVINNASIYGTISEKNGELRIDMQNTEFKFLKFDKLHFDHDSEVLGKGTSINFFVLHPLNFSQRREVNLCGDVLPSGADFPLTLWTHLYHSFIDDNMYECMRILEKDEIEYVEDYFNSFQKNLKNAVAPDYSLFAHDNEANRNMWKFDLVRGFATFHCGKADQYEIRGYILNGDASSQITT